MYNAIRSFFSERDKRERKSERRDNNTTIMEREDWINTDGWWWYHSLTANKLSSDIQTEVYKV